MKKMNRQILGAAVLCLAITSCKDSDTNNTANPLLGKWKLDSVSVPTDTSFSAALFLQAMATDSAIHFTFEKDHILTHNNNGADTTRYTIDVQKKQLLTEDSASNPMQYTLQDEKHFSLLTRDSTRLYFVKSGN